VQRQFRYLLVVTAVLTAVAAGCASPVADRPAGAVAAEAADVWFMQHLVPHLRQTVAVVALSEDRIVHPQLARLAEATQRQSQAHLELLQAWLDRRGLAPMATATRPWTGSPGATWSAWPGCPTRASTAPSLRCWRPGSGPATSSPPPSSARAACPRSTSSPAGCRPSTAARSGS